MKKLKLTPDHLRVDSFVTTRSADARQGTVHANQVTAPTACGCVSTIFTMGCYDLDGDTVYDYYAPGNTLSEYQCTNEN